MFLCEIYSFYFKVSFYIILIQVRISQETEEI